MIFEKLASAIRNDIVSGLRGLHNTMSMSLELLQDDIVDERLLIIKEYTLKGILPVKDLILSINCVEVDCKDIERCRCGTVCGEPIAHFEIPQVVAEFGDSAIHYIGTTDRETPFLVYTSLQSLKWSKYKKRSKNKPYVYVDTTPNENGMYDCFLYNMPLIKNITVVAVFKDPRQLERYSCCNSYNDDNYSFLNNEIKKRLTLKKLNYYRQLAAPLMPNNQIYAEG